MRLGRWHFLRTYGLVMNSAYFKMSPAIGKIPAQRSVMILVTACVLIGWLFTPAFSQDISSPAEHRIPADELQTLYRDAVRLYKQRHYEEAKTKFNEILRWRMDYKATKKLLKKIDVLQERRRQKEAHREDVLARKRRAYEKKERLKETRVAYRAAVAAFKAKRYTFARDQLAHLKSLLHTDLLTDSIRIRMSDKAAGLEQRMDKNAGERVPAEDPSPMSAKHSGGPVNLSKDIPRRSFAAAPTQNFSPAVQERTHDQPRQEKSAGITRWEEDFFKEDRERQIEELQNDLPLIKDRKDLGHHIKERQGHIEKQQRALQQQLAQAVEELYRDALKLYKEGSRQAAYDLFDEVDQLWPGYKEARSYLESMESQQAGENRPQADREHLINETLDAFEQDLHF